MSITGSQWASVWNERGERRCSKCKQWKKPEEYYRRPGRGTLMSICKACHNEWQNDRRRAKRANKKDGAENVPGPAPLNWTPAWTRPPADAAWGYCAQCGEWTHSNGNGPHMCKEGHRFEPVKIARMFDRGLPPQ